ncbi:hypothetical protein [Arthrobacter crystallopoietes]|uniref:Uncharacterized protein n=1 Tax=Crystallibacter crystallopoietes TaxID=37928 RepID=A0A1H1AEL0_9MICC|nr:hypothetical protein [Arthrobacter crystallopoietes]AUI51558.1 hypothetical protein AC20117_12865 [Arthrobacter crystallopoietes]SDQ38112.1 hypothetical protein SAMN04489742_0891 [Arthrobacter crystallopoietes]
MMDDELKQVWAASAALETLQVEMDQAQLSLKEAIDEAAKAGADPESIDEAAQLTSVELTEPVELAGPAEPSRSELEPS